MADFEIVEKYEGTFKPTGDDIKFKKKWGNHDFSEAECEALIAGNEISFKTKSNAGQDYTAKGKLAKQEYNGHEYWGFKRIFDNDKKKQTKKSDD